MPNPRYVVCNLTSGEYARPSLEPSYTSKLEEAAIYETRAEAERSRRQGERVEVVEY